MASDFRYLSLRQLRLVAKLGSALSLSSAAHDLNMTQPAASRSLAQLESLLGTKLFDRSSKALTPTAAGMRFIHHAQRVLDQLDAAEHEIAGASVIDEVRIGAIASISSHLLAAAVHLANAELPHVRVRVLSGNIGYLYGQLLNGSLDLMISHAELSVDLNRVVVTPIYEEYTSIVSGIGHRYTRRKTLSWRDIADQPWILPPAFTPSRPKLDRVLAVYRSAPMAGLSDVEVESSSVALQLLSGGQYLWSLAHREARMWEKAGLIRVLVQPDSLLQGHMCTLQLRGAHNKEALRNFVQILNRCASLPSELS